MVLGSSTAQVLLKYAGMHAAERQISIQLLMQDWAIWAAGIALAFSMLCWLTALRKIKLAVAYPCTALIYVITPLVSYLLFDDQLKIGYLFGLASIVPGVILTTGGVVRE